MEHACAHATGVVVAGFGAIHGKLYVAGGSDGVTQLNTLYIYDIASNTWTTGANMPVAEEAAGSAVLQNNSTCLEAFRR